MFADLMMSGDAIVQLTSVNTCMSSSRQHLSTPAWHRPVNIYQHLHVIVPSTSINTCMSSSRQHLSTPAWHRPVNIYQHLHVIVPSTSINTCMSSCRQHLLTLAGHCPVNFYQHQHVIVPSTSVNIRQHQHVMAPSHLSTSAYHRPVNICQHQHVVVPSTSVNTSRADLVGKIKILVHIWHQQINSKSFHLLFSFASLPAKPLSFSFLGDVMLYTSKRRSGLWCISLKVHLGCRTRVQ